MVAALDDPSELTVADLEPVYDTSGWRDWSYERELEGLRNGRHQTSRPFRIEDVSITDAEATAVLAGGDGKSWTLTVWVEDEAPFRINRARLVPTPPEGMTIRLASPEDGPALGDLERRAPLRLGEEPLTFVTFDHGDDYFGPSRLMEEETTYVAELDGRLVGVYGGTLQPVHVAGEEKHLFLEHHVRIDPEAPRGAVFWALCTFGRDRYARAADSIAFYVSPENLALRKFTAGVPPWPVAPVRALLPCRADPAADDVGASVGADDAAGAVEILNRCHRNAALFLPYTEVSLDARLTRDPEQYGWSDLRAAGEAVVGVGRRIVTVTRARDGDVAVTRRAIALDHGFAPGAEDDYRTLLRWWCARLATQGATHLAVFTSEHASTYEVVMEMAERVEPFDFWAFDIPEPPTLGDHGFYVDPVYF